MLVSFQVLMSGKLRGMLKPDHLSSVQRSHGQGQPEHETREVKHASGVSVHPRKIE